MTRNELERKLSEAGFSLTPHRRHRIWRNGDRVVTMSRGMRINSRLARLTLVNIKRATV